MKCAWSHGSIGAGEGVNERIRKETCDREIAGLFKIVQVRLCSDQTNDIRRAYLPLSSFFFSSFFLLLHDDFAVLLLLLLLLFSKGPER